MREAPDDPLHIFAFGSLIGAPELPKLVLSRVPARLRGVRRSFNKRSRTRQCAAGDSFAAIPGVAAEFLVDGHYRSLVLGTVDDPQQAIDGVLLAYPAAYREQVLRATDAREGFAADRDSRANGYLRVTREAERLDRPGLVTCEVYLSNPDPRHRYFVAPDLTTRDRARVLINATPGRRAPLPGSDTRGLYYLEDVRTALHTSGIIDTHLEQLVAAVHALPGPWCAALHPPRCTTSPSPVRVEPPESR